MSDCADIASNEDGDTPIQVATLSVHRFDSWRARLWAFGQMTFARWSLWRLSDCGFWKLCGSGGGGGFAPAPNPAIWAILACWPDEATARRHHAEAGVFRRWRARAAESYTLYLLPVSSRGAWSGRQPFDTSPDREGPVASLTRASIRPRHLGTFWSRVPSVSRRIAEDGAAQFRIGISALPWLHQATFSVWPDTQAMAAFARRDGAHAAAIRAVREGDWFSEELYARFRVIATEGSWSGARIGGQAVAA